MGRSLGYFDSDELDRPELNKCPDCECYFATEECPLCGKICPEEMRAGNRKPVKPPKKTKNSSGRVQFISWYHSWWFILIMFFVSRIAGLILFITSPYSKKAKIITAASVIGGYLLLFTAGTVLLPMLWNQPLVNDKVSREEYVEMCEDMDVESFYRVANDYGRYVCLELTVIEKNVEHSIDVYDTGATYYLCRDINGGDIVIYVQDCNLGEPMQFLPGDMIRVYGESAGMMSFLDGSNYTSERPCVYMAYCELIG